MAMAMECRVISLQACGVGHMWSQEDQVVQCVRLRARCAPLTVTMSMQKLKRLQVQRVDLMLHDLRLASATPLPLLRQVADALVEEMSAGLEREGGSERLKMLPSDIEHLPSGNEKGLFYAVDLGGTNFRVLRVCLGGKKGEVFSQEYKEMAIPRELMTGTGKDLLGFIASTLAKFVDTEDISLDPNPDKPREAGFAFSFPVRQTSVKSGIVIHWTKGFKIDDAVCRSTSFSKVTHLRRKSMSVSLTYNTC